MERIHALWKRAAAVLPVLLLSAAVYAQITPLGDSYTNSADPTTNYGAKTLLDVDGATQVTYIQFNLASIPAGASLSQATLKLYVNAVTTAGSFNVDYVNGTWTESTLDYSNAPALGTTIVSGVALTTASKNQYILVDITPAVQAWLDGSQANDGIALVANSTFNASFDSKENTGTSHAPELDIVFAGGGTITGVTTASGSGLQGGGTSGTLNLSLSTACAANQVLEWNGSAWACTAVGTGTITGVTAGTDLTGGGTGGNVTLNLNTTLVPQLNTANTFTGNQTVNGNLSATGLVTGAGFNIGSYTFAFGSYGFENVFLGFAGNTTLTGEYNTGSGFEALYSNTTGNYNTADGMGALYHNTTGYYNTAEGMYALVSNTTGYNNTAAGAYTLADSTGNGNTGNGFSALSQNTTGSNNTATGDLALYYNYTGNNNTALGYQAGPDSSSNGLSNTTAIGADAVVSESNALVLGCVSGVNSCPAAVNVGIGTATPAYTLDVHGTGNFTGLVNFASGQTFPGTGTITGVTAGTGLSGGGTSGTVTLNNTGVLGVTAGTGITSSGGQTPTIGINTSVVPGLAANNTFTGSQTINNNVTITAAGTTLTASGGSTGLSGTGSSYGVSGTSSSGNGVYGFSSGNYGIFGVSNATGMTGVAGNYEGSTGGSGVSGWTVSTSGIGVYGLSSGSQGYGVYGANSAGSGYSAVYGDSYSSTGYAGYFNANVAVTGTLTKGGGSFKIDHPLDPANKYLYHSFVESPDMKNIYDGVVVLDRDGSAWVALPDYFEALNRDFRYQLTAIGAPGPNLYIAQEITSNRFQIAGGTAGGKVSWQVTGIRQDAYANAHRIVPEVEKTGEERGRYLHPVENGMPKSMGIDEYRRSKMLLPHAPEPSKLPEHAAVSPATK